MPVDGLVAGSLAATPGIEKGVGTPDTTAGALSASSYTMLAGTLVSLPALQVGSRFRFTVGTIKTAAGTNTWAARVAMGTHGSTSDSAVATWTSGTNTGAIDQAILIIECVVASLGTSAVLNCTAFYCNTLTNATGLGTIAAAPGSTATFNSTTATYIHVDIEPGSGATQTGWGMAEQII